MVAGFVNLKDELVRDFIESNYGKESYLVLLALDRSGKTDEQISKKINLKVNEIRSCLNKLNYAGIIYYTKEKSPTSNWYTYTWFVKKERIGELIKERYKEDLEDLKKKLNYENTYTFFKCVKGCTKLPFELAFEYDFKCPECGSEMKSYNNVRDKKKLKDKINQIEKFLKEEEEREKIRRELKKKEREKEEAKEEAKKEAAGKNKQEATKKKKNVGKKKIAGKKEVKKKRTIKKRTTKGKKLVKKKSAKKRGTKKKKSIKKKKVKKKSVKKRVLKKKVSNRAASKKASSNKKKRKK